MPFLSEFTREGSIHSIVMEVDKSKKNEQEKVLRVWRGLIESKKGFSEIGCQPLNNNQLKEDSEMHLDLQSDSLSKKNTRGRISFPLNYCSEGSESSSDTKLVDRKLIHDSVNVNENVVQAAENNSKSIKDSEICEKTQLHQISEQKSAETENKALISSSTDFSVDSFLSQSEKLEDSGNLISAEIIAAQKLSRSVTENGSVTEMKSKCFSTSEQTDRLNVSSKSNNEDYEPIATDETITKIKMKDKAVDNSQKTESGEILMNDRIENSLETSSTEGNASFDGISTKKLSHGEENAVSQNSCYRKKNETSELSHEKSDNNQETDSQKYKDCLLKVSNTALNDEIKISPHETQHNDDIENCINEQADIQLCSTVEGSV